VAKKHSEGEKIHGNGFSRVIKVAKCLFVIYKLVNDIMFLCVWFVISLCFVMQDDMTSFAPWCF
jgi:hypothetical protein